MSKVYYTNMGTTSCGHMHKSIRTALSCLIKHDLKEMTDREITPIKNGKPIDMTPEELEEWLRLVPEVLDSVTSKAAEFEPTNL